MQSKLTLRLDDQLILRAKAHAKQTGKSVSQLVAGYFALFEPIQEPDEASLPPVTRALYGALETADVDEQNYYKHIEEKYR